MTSSRETYGQAARQRDLLRDSVELAVPKLNKARQLLAGTANRWEIDEPPARDPRPHRRSRLMPADRSTSHRTDQGGTS